MAEMLDRRLLGKGAFRAQKRHAHGLFQRQAYAHHFAEQARHGFPVDGALIAFLDAAQHLGFPLRAVKHRLGVLAALHFGHLVGELGAVIEQILEPLVQVVDLISQLVQ